MCGVFGVLDFRREGCGRDLDFAAATETPCFGRPPLVDRIIAGLELDSEVVWEVDPDVSSDCCGRRFFSEPLAGIKG